MRAGSGRAGEMGEIALFLWVLASLIAPFASTGQGEGGSLCFSRVIQGEEASSSVSSRAVKTISSLLFLLFSMGMFSAFSNCWRAWLANSGKYSGVPHSCGECIYGLLLYVYTTLDLPVLWSSNIGYPAIELRLWRFHYAVYLNLSALSENRSLYCSCEGVLRC